MKTYNIIIPFISSGTAVWAVSPTGSVYCRYGITNTNFVGDYWKKIPGSVKAVTGNVTYSMAHCKVTYMSQRIVGFPCVGCWTAWQWKCNSYV
jgi:hypothetical protein